MMDQLEDRVTFHAVTRYVQRVLGVIVDFAGKGRPEAEAHCAAAGVSVDAVRLAILSPGVIKAFNAGFRKIRVDGVQVVFNDDGRVVTVHKEPGRWRPAARMNGKREGRRIAHQIRRRDKRWRA